jgi:alcohol dehydrogenase
MAGFKDFYQYVDHTRVIAGRGLIESTGFEFMKEGADRVFIVTDEVIRGTGLIDKVQAGVEDGGLEVAGIFDGVPQDSSTHVVEECAAAAKEAGADSFLAVGGGSVMDTAKVADAVFTHGGTAREQEGFFLMPRGGDGMGAPDPIAPLACIPTTAGTGSEVSMAAVIKDP